jgi:hypothetical protein
MERHEVVGITISICHHSCSLRQLQVILRPQRRWSRWFRDVNKRGKVKGDLNSDKFDIRPPTLSNVSILNG